MIDNNLRDKIEKAIYNSFKKYIREIFTQEESEWLLKNITCTFNRSFTSDLFHQFFMSDNDTILYRLSSMNYNHFIIKKGFFIKKLEINYDKINAYAKIPQDCIDRFRRFIDNPPYYAWPLE
jgi:hypothetical protein